MKKEKKKYEEETTSQNSWSLKFEYMWCVVHHHHFTICERFMWTTTIDDEDDDDHRTIQLNSNSVTIDRIWKFVLFLCSFGARSRYLHIGIFPCKLIETHHVIFHFFPITCKYTRFSHWAEFRPQQNRWEKNETDFRPFNNQIHFL